MAIVFVSPKKKQITFFVSIGGFFLFILILIALIVFLSKPAVVSEGEIFKKPNININLSVLDSNELKSLFPLDPVQYVFFYQANTEKGKSASGKITATDEDDAKAKLTDMKLSNIEVQKELTGRDNPFDVYYQTTIVKNPKTK